MHSCNHFIVVFKQISRLKLQSLSDELQSSYSQADEIKQLHNNCVNCRIALSKVAYISSLSGQTCEKGLLKNYLRQHKYASVDALRAKSYYIYMYSIMWLLARDDSSSKLSRHQFGSFLTIYSDKKGQLFNVKMSHFYAFDILWI